MTRLKQYRKASGLSRKDFAFMCDIPERTIEAYEQGLRPLTGAGIGKLIKMSKILSVDPFDLIGETMKDDS